MCSALDSFNSRVAHFLLEYVNMCLICDHQGLLRCKPIACDCAIVICMLCALCTEALSISALKMEMYLNAGCQWFHRWSLHFISSQFATNYHLRVHAVLTEWQCVIEQHFPVAIMHFSFLFISFSFEFSLTHCCLRIADCQYRRCDAMTSN